MKRSSSPIRKVHMDDLLWQQHFLQTCAAEWLGLLDLF
jgi:hypothetical protein